MIKTIFKYFHRPIFQLPAFLCPIGSLKNNEALNLSKSVKFKPNCAYNLNNAKQRDWNKLFGVCFGIVGIHKTSVRFGWRYREDLDLIELCVIIYRENQKPIRETVAYLNIDFEYNLEISILRKDNSYKVYFKTFGVDVYNIILDCNSSHYYGCGFYFGGKSRAPHKMFIDIKNN